MWKQSLVYLATFCGIAIAACTPTGDTSSESGEARVISLTQTGCQFVEVESQDYQYQTTSSEDCEKINRETLSERQNQFKPLALKAGKYIFRVTNRDVPYELGFYLRGEGVRNLTLPKVSGGSLTEGSTRNYEITLRPGKYIFSCPLNPTPDYPVIVN